MKITCSTHRNNSCVFPGGLVRLIFLQEKITWLPFLSRVCKISHDNMKTSCNIGINYLAEFFMVVLNYQLGPRWQSGNTLTSEAGVRFLAWPHVGKLVVACRWLAVYSTES